MFYASGLFSTIVILTKRFFTIVISTKRSAWKDLSLNVLSGVSPDIKPCCYYEKI